MIMPSKWNCLCSNIFTTYKSRWICVFGKLRHLRSLVLLHFYKICKSYLYIYHGHVCTHWWRALYGCYVYVCVCSKYHHIYCQPNNIEINKWKCTYFRSRRCRQLSLSVFSIVPEPTSSIFLPQQDDPFWCTILLYNRWTSSKLLNLLLNYHVFQRCLLK